jgi:hypothetical protein
MSPRANDAKMSSPVSPLTAGGSAKLPTPAGSCDSVYPDAGEVVKLPRVRGRLNADITRGKTQVKAYRNARSPSQSLRRVARFAIGALIDAATRRRWCRPAVADERSGPLDAQSAQLRVRRARPDGFDGCRGTTSARSGTTGAGENDRSGDCVKDHRAFRLQPCAHALLCPPLPRRPLRPAVYGPQHVPSSQYGFRSSPDFG